MKNTLPRMSLIMATGLLCYACDTKQTDRPQPLAAGAEEKINLVNHPLSEEQGIFQIETGKKSILIDSSLQIPATADSIRPSAMLTMKQLALQLKGADTNNYILALRIIYGLDANKQRMKLYYQPVFLKRVTPTGTSHIMFEPKESPDYYYYNSNPKDTCFVHEPNVATVDSARARYARHVFFEKKNGTFRPNYVGTSDTSDVTSCVFPFEEIKEMVSQNASKYVYIINSGEEITAKNNKTYLRHVMILGPDILDHKLDNIFFRKYANLTHLCPPNCTQHFFDLK